MKDCSIAAVAFLSPKSVPLATEETVLRLYKEQYFDFNVRHFHEKLSSEHQIELSYTWVKQSLQGAGLVKTRRKRGKHRKRRPRRPLLLVRMWSAVTTKKLWK